MPDYTYGFQSTASNVYDNLQKLLSQRKAEARQAMLDKLNEENTRSLMEDRIEDRAVRRENIAASKEAREALAEERKARALKLITDQLDPDQDLSGNPELVEKLKAAGLIDMRTMTPDRPDVSTTMSSGTLPNGEKVDIMGMPGMSTGMDVQPPSSLLPPPDSRPFYRGNRDQREEKARQQRQSAILSDPNFKDYDELTKFMIMRNAFEKGENFPSSLFDKVSPIPVFDEATGKSSYMTGPDGKPITATNPHVITRSRPPQGPRDTGTYLGPARDINGQEIPGKVMMMQNGRIVAVPLPDGISAVGPKPTNGRAAGAASVRPITSSEATNLAKLKAKATSSGWFGGPSASAVAAYESALSSIIVNWPGAPNRLKQIVGTAMNEFNPNEHSVAFIVDQLLNEQIIDPSEAQAAALMLSIKFRN